MRHDDPNPVEVSSTISAAPDAVFRFFTESALFSQWVAAEAEIDPQVGGQLAVGFTGHATRVEGEVTELVPGERIAFTWGVAEGRQKETLPVGSTEVELQLESAGEGTKVTLRHAGLPTEEEKAGHRGGWTHYLQQLSRACREVVLAEGLEERLDSFCKAWSEAKDDARAYLLGIAVGDDFEYVDQHARVRGRDAFHAHLGMVIGMFPGATVSRSGAPQQCYEFVEYPWECRTAEGQLMGKGHNHVTLASDGRLERVVAFWD